MVRGSVAHTRTHNNNNSNNNNNDNNNDNNKTNNKNSNDNICTITTTTTITTLHILYARLSLWRLFPQATALWVLKTPAARRGVATGRESRPAGGRCHFGGPLVPHMIVTGFWFKLASLSPPPAHFSRYKTWFGGRLPAGCPYADPQ